MGRRTGGDLRGKDINRRNPQRMRLQRVTLQRVITPLLPVVTRLRDGHRRLVSFSLFGLVTTLAYTLSFIVRFEFRWPGEYTAAFVATLPILLYLRLTLAHLLKLSTTRWRFAGTQDLLRLWVATTIGSVIFYVLTWELRIPGPVPRSVILLEWVLTGYGIGGMWLTYRVLFQEIRHTEAKKDNQDRRVLVVGAGEAAALLVGEMQRFPTGFHPVGMVDDDPFKWGTRTRGVEVIGSIADVRAIAEAEEAEELIIALPSATPSELNRIVMRCEETELPFRMLPGIPEVLAGQAGLHQLRPVELEDLLGREPVSLDLPELSSELERQCVMVTGAAGSIGSELSRQIALHGPESLILVDQAETPLVELERNLMERFPDLSMVLAVADVTDRRAMTRLFNAHHPHQVFHAAAYKHVPTLEDNPEAAVWNNLVGTWNVARMAGEFGTGKFILVSTDKAVRPANVMGATKRLAELVILAAQGRFPKTSFGAVRFGNVLGSSGSVIPLFRQQLEEGKPLTVTHSGMTRYFMTIPEAVQLVLQASLLPDLRGQVAMLDMGEPVRILELAQRILRLSGQPCKIGEQIVFTGVRPGEKLEEALTAPGEKATVTSHPKISIVKSTDPFLPRVLARVEAWERAFREGREWAPLREVDALFPAVDLRARPEPRAASAARVGYSALSAGPAAPTPH
jgi:FlaA1/EpsC-like NDP-sugar epimerase